MQWLETPQVKRLRMMPAASDDASVFDLLSVQIENLRSQLGTVFYEAGLVDSDGKVVAAVKQGCQVKTDAEGEVFIEVVDCFVLPFDLHATGAAIWKLLTTSSMDYGNGQHQVQYCDRGTFCHSRTWMERL